MVPAAQIRALEDALQGVSTNGQALAIADLCLSTVRKVRDQFNPWISAVASWFTFGLYGAANGDRVAAGRSLEDAIVDVERYREPMVGDPTGQVGSSWDDLSHAIGRAYNIMWNVLDVEGDEPEWKSVIDWAGATITGSIEAMPSVISATVAYTGNLATNTAGGVVSGVLAGFWPVLLIAGGVLVVAVYALGAGNVAKLAKGGA